MSNESGTATSHIPLEWTATLITRSGISLKVRPVLAEDEPTLEALFAKISPTDLHFRFLSSLRHVDHAHLIDMIKVDYDRTITFLAFDEANEPVATAMVAGDPDGREAEVAISVRSDLKGRGIGWSLLQHVLRYAKSKGYKSVRSIESRENAATIGLERDAGFSIHSCEGDLADVVATKWLTEPRP